MDERLDTRSAAPLGEGEGDGEAKVTVVQLLELSLTYAVYLPFDVFILGVFHAPVLHPVQASRLFVAGSGRGDRALR